MPVSGRSRHGAGPPAPPPRARGPERGASPRPRCTWPVPSPHGVGSTSEAGESLRTLGSLREYRKDRTKGVKSLVRAGVGPFTLSLGWSPRKTRPSATRTAPKTYIQMFPDKLWAPEESPRRRGRCSLSPRATVLGHGLDFLVGVDIEVRVPFWTIAVQLDSDPGPVNRSRVGGERCWRLPSRGHLGHSEERDGQSEPRPKAETH